MFIVLLVTLCVVSSVVWGRFCFVCDFHHTIQLDSGFWLDNWIASVHILLEQKAVWLDWIVYLISQRTFANRNHSTRFANIIIPHWNLWRSLKEISFEKFCDRNYLLIARYGPTIFRTIAIGDITKICSFTEQNEN